MRDHYDISYGLISNLHDLVGIIFMFSSFSSRSHDPINISNLNQSTSGSGCSYCFRLPLWFGWSPARRGSHWRRLLVHCAARGHALLGVDDAALCLCGLQPLGGSMEGEIDPNRNSGIDMHILLYHIYIYMYVYIYICIHRCVCILCIVSKSIIVWESLNVIIDFHRKIG